MTNRDNNSGAVVVRKSNDFVTAKFKTTLLGNKIIAVSLTKLEEKNGQLQAVLSPQEIRKLLGMDNDTNIYKKLKSVSHNLAGHQIFLEDGRGNFKVFNMITNVDYVNSELTVRFNSDLNSSISQLRGQYTSFELATLTSFERNNTYRLYEILKKEAWRINEDPNGMCSKEYGVNELKCMIGLVNTDQPYIAKAVQEKKSWDEIVDVICKKEDKQFDNFSDFRTRVLIPAQREMAEKSDIRFEFETERYGRGGKVKKIIFHIYRNEISDDAEDQILSKVEKIEQTVPKYAQESRNYVASEEMGIYRELKDYLEEKGIDTEPFTTTEFYRIYRAAKNNVGVIRQEIDYSLNIPNIRNYYGWLMEAVRERYSKKKNVEVIYGSSKRAEQVNEVKAQTVSQESLNQLWEKYKNRPEFDAFIDTFEFPDVDYVETCYPVEERIAKFIDFKRRLK